MSTKGVFAMDIKEKITAVQKVCGTHINLSDPIVCEIMSSVGYDFLWVDMEHTSMSPNEVYHHILASKHDKTPVFVRVPVDDLTAIKKVLEMGVDGIIFPMVRDSEHAKQLLDYTLYPPYGKRGCGPKGAVRYNPENEVYYYGEGHLKMCRFVQIELKSAAEDAERIANLSYLDGCILGMHDLSGSIGRLGDIFCEENLYLAKKAISAFKKAGKTVGVSTFATDEETLKRYDSMGINMISTGADYDYILKKSKETLGTINKIQDRR